MSAYININYQYETSMKLNFETDQFDVSQKKKNSYSNEQFLNNFQLL